MFPCWTPKLHANANSQVVDKLQYVVAFDLHHSRVIPFHVLYRSLKARSAHVNFKHQIQSCHQRCSWRDHRKPGVA
jgi:hypothetical protein